MSQMQDVSLRAKSVLKAEMARRGVGYDELSARLKTVGLEISAQALRSKVSRGAFSADVFLGCLSVLGVEQLRLNQ